MKVVAVDGEGGPTHAMMIALNVDEPGDVVAWVAEVAERFSVERTLAPPDTTMLLVTIIGPLSADRLAAGWRERAAGDPVLSAYLSMMQTADVVQATTAGEPLSEASLLGSG